MLGRHAEDGELMWPSMEASREQFSLTFFYNFFSSTMPFEKNNSRQWSVTKNSFGTTVLVVSSIN